MVTAMKIRIAVVVLKKFSVEFQMWSELVGFMKW